MSWDIISALIVGSTLGGVFGYLFGWSKGWNVGYARGVFHTLRIEADVRYIEGAVRRGIT